MREERARRAERRGQWVWDQAWALEQRGSTVWEEVLETDPGGLINLVFALGPWALPLSE